MVEKDEELSFETLLKLRDEVGLKIYQQFEAEKFYGNNKQDSKKRKQKSRKDSDDEAPIEMSSKHPFKKNKSSQNWKTETRTLDPRFSNRSGKYNEDKFRKNFNFAFEMRDQELQKLKNTQAENEKELSKRKYLIQRIENQKRESQKRIKKQSNKNVEILPNGEKFYKKKSVQRTEDLVNKFIELKNSGKLEKHLDKRRKRIAGKERKKMNIEK